MMWLRSRLRKRLHAVPGLYTFRIAALVVLGAGLLITGLLWASSRQRINQDAYNSFDASVSKLSEEVSERAQTYSEILRGGVGLFKANGQVSGQQWHDFIGNYDVGTRYPGFAAIGYAKSIVPADAELLTEELRATTSSEISINPVSGLGTHVVVLFAEDPAGPVAVTGFDMYSEPARRAAIIAARDKAATVISDKVVLVFDKETKQPSFLMYTPVYKSGMPITNATERQAAIDGYVFSSFRVSNFLRAIDKSLDSGKFSMQLYSGDKIESSQLLFSTANAVKLSDDPFSISITKQIKMPDKQWTAVYRAKPSLYIASSESRRPLLTVLSGFIFSITLASFLYMLMLSRARFISRNQQMEVQRAKDDLLSLASHQLRTPATGVKQYIGMVLQGYVGQIDKEQRAMLEKAYESNERQLETINQILYVTKADAGRLKLNKTKFDIIEMIRDVLAEQGDTIKKREQKTKLKFHKKSQSVYADKQYVRMAVENLISNASKYSYEKAKIHITTAVDNGQLYLSVADEGVGIAEEDLPKLFNKFSRIDNDLSVKAGGSGIGLYLSKQVAHLHGGDIIVKSVMNRGSTFTLLLPIKRGST